MVEKVQYSGEQRYEFKRTLNSIHNTWDRRLSAFAMLAQQTVRTVRVKTQYDPTVPHSIPLSLVSTHAMPSSPRA